MRSATRLHRAAMRRRNYRKAPQHWLLWTGIVFTGLVVQAGLMVWLSADGWTVLPWGWTLGLSILPFVVAVFCGWWVLARLKRRRIEQLVAASAGLGFALDPQRTAAQRTALFAPLAPLANPLELRDGADRLVWIAPATRADDAALLFEHEYTTGSGKFTQTFTHTVVAWPASHASIAGTHLASPGPFTLAYDPLLRRRALQKSAADVPSLGDLGRSWRVYGNPQSAARFLTPGVRSQLASSPVGERWYAGNGWVCCLFAADVDAANLTAFVNHARLVLLSAVR